MSSPEDEATISIPSIAVVAVLGYLIYRYFFAGSERNSADSLHGSSRSGAGGARYSAAQVDQVAQMFPQLSRRDIMWDLHRNRGSVQATTERVLMGGRLDPAPPTFQPPPHLYSALPPTGPGTGAGNIASNAAAGAPGTMSALLSAASGSKSHIVHPDLITRYNLQDRVDAASKGKSKEAALASGWSATKDARQRTLQQRRDEMILAARRKMMEKDEDAQNRQPEQADGLDTL